MEDFSRSGIDGYAARLIGFKAKQLTRRLGFSSSDRPDIEQELWLDLLDRLPRYEPGKAAINTFVACVVERKIASILRHHFAQMRTPHREEGSLDEPVLDGDGCTVLRYEVTPEVASDTGRYRDLERDTAAVVAGLPDDLRVIVLGLATGKPNSVGAELGISRRTMIKKLAELREIFHNAGLNHYL